MIEDGLDFEHNVADAELIGSPQARLEHHREIKLLGADDLRDRGQRRATAPGHAARDRQNTDRSLDRRRQLFYLAHRGGL